MNISATQKYITNNLRKEEEFQIKLEKSRKSYLFHGVSSSLHAPISNKHNHLPTGGYLAI